MQKEVRSGNLLIWLGSLVFISCLFLSFGFASAELDLSVNAQLSSFDTDFYLQTDSNALTGYDFLDFEQQGFPSGDYSFLYSVVSGKNLIADAFPSSNRTIYLVYKVNPSSSGTLLLSWLRSAFGYNYDSVLTDYGSDGSYSNAVNSVSMNSQSSYSVDSSGTTRYFSISINYFNFSCGDGVCNTGRGEDCSSCSADCGCSSGQTCNSGVCANSGGGGSDGGGETQPPACTDSSWTTVSTGSCIYGQKAITQTKCGDTRTIYEDCCVASTIYGDWSECSRSNTRTRDVQQTSESCVVIDSVETGSCTFNCVESWSCDWGSCQNGFISPINCVDANNCGTTDSKPSSLSCSQQENITQIFTQGIREGEQSFLEIKENCSVSLVCDDWSACSVKSGLDDLKNVRVNLDGIKTRRCVDKNNCLSAPYFEQQKCSLKLFIQPKKEIVCGQEYLSIYQEGSDYLLARIKDERLSRGTLSMRFFLGGKETDTSCGEKVIGEYFYSSFEKIMSFSDLRKLWGLFR